MVKISIIIPVYNGEQYISECLDSVFRQTLHDLEIICIDDGSTDKTSDVINEYIKKDDRVILLQQSNQGAGRARNQGINIAKGKYIAFLDADDFYSDTNALELMYTACEKHQVSACGSLRKSLENGKLRPENTFEEFLEEGSEVNVLDYRKYQFDYYYQNFLYNRELILKYNIFFPPYRRFQDPPFLVRALYQSGKFAMVRTYLHVYRLANIMSRLNPDKMVDVLHGVIDNLRFADMHNLDILFDITADRIEYELSNMLYYSMASGNKKILELLLEINDIIGKRREKPDYVIRPLQKLFSGIQREKDEYQEAIVSFLSMLDQFAVYGAGGLARKFLKYLNERNLLDKVSCIIVSDLGSEIKDIEGIPIISLSDFGKESRIFIAIAVGSCYHKEILENLQRYNISSYEIIDDVFLNELWIDDVY